MKQKLQKIIAACLIAISILWLIPAVCVEDNVETNIVSYKLEKDAGWKKTYEVTFAYQMDGKEKNGTYSVAYTGETVPVVGGQGKCFVYTVPPYSAHNGDPISPFYPLCVLIIGILLLFFELKCPKLLKKLFRKKKKEVKTAEAIELISGNESREECSADESQS